MGTYRDRNDAMDAPPMDAPPGQTPQPVRETTRATCVAWVGVLAWMALIFWLSSIPGSDMPTEGGWLAHFAAYAVLGALLTTALSGHVADRARVIALAVIIASAYGVTDEVHQSFVPGRHPDVVDWGYDTLGAFAGALALAFGGPLRRIYPPDRPSR